MDVIGLCMIVKNESHVILDCLNSIYKRIDTFVITDTGSTDGTQDIIRKFFEEKGIQGEVHDRPWRGFGESRTESLKLCEGKMDYAWVIDADDTIVGDGDIREYLHDSPNCLDLQIVSPDNFKFWRRQVFRVKDNWRYVGVLHEYATCDVTPLKINRVTNGVENHYRTTGSRNNNPNKYKDEAEMLLKEITEKPDDPSVNRYMFYLARSYTACKDSEQAAIWYKKRIEVGDWYEEIWYSMYMLSLIYGTSDWVWKSVNLIPQRNEAIFHYVRNKRFNNTLDYECYAMICLAAKNPYPNLYLFIQADIYNWMTLYELFKVSSVLNIKDTMISSAKTLLAEKREFLPLDIVAELELYLSTL